MRERVLATFEMRDGTYDLTAYEIGSGGPVAVYTAGVHGDETGPQQVAERLLDEVDEDALEGTLRIVPEANPFACMEQWRTTPHPDYTITSSEETDLNRTFNVAREMYLDGELAASRANLTQQIAYHLLTYVAEADYLIDGHSAAWPEVKMPQVRYKYREEFDADQDVMEGMVRHAGLPYAVIDRPNTLQESMLGAVAPDIGVPAVTIEIGGAERTDDMERFTEEDADRYAESVTNILKHLDVLDGEAEEHDVTELTSLQQYYAPVAGEVTYNYDLGDHVEQGDVVAELVGDDTALSVTAGEDGVLEAIAVLDGPVNQGTRVFNLVTYRD